MPKPKSNRSFLRRIPRAEREALAEQIREAIAEEHLPRLLSDIEADPAGWSVVYHFGGGRDVRNFLRFQGFTEKWSGLRGRNDHIDVVLDQVWAPLVELAMQSYEPPPHIRKQMKCRPLNHRSRAKRRAYGRAAAAAAAAANAARDAQTANESAECA